MPQRTRGRSPLFFASIIVRAFGYSCSYLVPASQVRHITLTQPVTVTLADSPCLCPGRTRTPAPGETDSLEYVVSLDSHPDVTNAVPRSRLSLTRDQAAIVRERRQPSLGQLTSLGSPSRHLSLGGLGGGMISHLTMVGGESLMG